MLRLARPLAASSGEYICRVSRAFPAQPCRNVAQQAGTTPEVQHGQDLWFQAPIASLECQRAKELDPEVLASPLRRFAISMLGYYSRESTAMRAGQAFWAAISEQADAPGFARAFSLPDTFQHMHSVLSLHVWLILQRLRTEGEEGREVGQAMYDEFQDHVERRARATGAKVRISKFLKEYESQFYGSSRALDQALEGKADLTATIARNIYLLDPSKREAASLLARYVKREIACLAVTPSEAVLKGNIRFSCQFYQDL